MMDCSAARSTLADEIRVGFFSDGEMIDLVGGA